MIRLFLCFSILFCSITFSNAQTLTSPKEHFGYNIGDNYKLTNYTQTEVKIEQAKTEMYEMC